MRKQGVEVLCQATANLIEYQWTGVHKEDRMREIRLHAKNKHVVVQPKPSIYIDADGQPVYE